MNVTPVEPRTGRFRPLTEDDLTCSAWFERDRAHLRLETPAGRTVVELWDEAVFEAIEDGFLTKPRHPRPDDDMWRPSLIEYAKEIGVILADGTLASKSSRSKR